ncbi:type II toxin-antitoxin system RelE/ParE family toxin [Solimicrobium silvestre]|uniref:Plasmid stabilization system protein n=1 Tax=Solimicrobium silvestre TaxID=2099400 RepID=A0A2S9H3R3_9BURK|nr:type II toxin-antitoxin system RelE/ParE family toxin [Solimicrobium silvestre]PRC94610.1 Plasmid stabilization system protein [Solimicrobium silvestre]
MELIWTPHARQARTAAIDYIAKDSPHAALAQLNEIERQTDMLIDYPEMERLGRVDGTRELVISNTSFVAIYRLNLPANRIELFRFVHSSQRWPATVR